jgi:hypothetical protein
VTIQRHQSKRALDELSFDEAMAQIKAIREDRKIVKFQRKAKAPPKPRTATPKQKDTLNAFLSGLTPAEREAFLKELTK